MVKYVLRCMTKVLSSFLIKCGLKHNNYLVSIQNLINNGLKLGKNVTIETTVYIDNVYPFLISIGDNCSIANGTRVLAHDDTPYKFIGGYARLGKVNIKDNCFIGENCIILPGVTIGPNVLVAAGSVVNKDIPENSCVAGVPARFYCKFSDFIDHQRNELKNATVFDYYDLHAGISDNIKSTVSNALEKGSCYVRGKRGRKINYIDWNK